MEAIKVAISICVASLGGDSALDAKAKEVRNLFSPKTPVAITFKQCDSTGKSIKGKRITFSE